MGFWLRGERIAHLLSRVLVCLLVGGVGTRGAWSADTGPAWQVHPPNEVDMSATRLEAAYHRARALAPLNSLLISRNDTRVGERYFRDMRSGRPVNIKSASKSVLSALVGIALEENVLEGLNQPIADYFPALRGGDVDPRKRRITLRHLLLMRSGLESTSFENYGPWVTSDNWVRYALRRPIVAPPGTETHYSTGNSHLVAVMLSRALDRDLRTYAQRKLFDPIDARIHAWQRDPKGYRFGGNNMKLTPSDLHAFGQLYLSGGRADGRQVVPREWIRASTRSYVHDTHHGFPYGYFWWNATYGGVDVNFAWGHGGQFVFVVPELDLVVTCTSTLHGAYPGDDHVRNIHALLRQRILPAVKEWPVERGWFEWLWRSLTGRSP